MPSRLPALTAIDWVWPISGSLKKTAWHLSGVIDETCRSGARNLRACRPGMRPSTVVSTPSISPIPISSD